MVNASENGSTDMISVFNLEYSIIGYISLLAMTSFIVVCGIGNSAQGKNSYENGASWNSPDFPSSKEEDQNSMQRTSWWDPAFHVTLIPSKVEHLPVAQNRIVFINCTSNGHFFHYEESHTDSSLPKRMYDDKNPSIIIDNSNFSSSSISSPISSSAPSTNDSTIQQQRQQQLKSAAQKRHQPSPYYIAMITSADSQVAIPTGPRDKVFKLDENRTDQILLRFQPTEGSMFTVQAEHVGYGVLIVQFYDQWDNREDDPIYWNLTNPIYELYFSVSVVRKVRWVDMTFDCVIAAVATLNAFSVGCDSDWASLHQHFKKPTTLLLATGCQMLINPLVRIMFIYFCIGAFLLVARVSFQKEYRSHT